MTITTASHQAAVQRWCKCRRPDQKLHNAFREFPLQLFFFASVLLQTPKSHLRVNYLFFQPLDVPFQQNESLMV